jgi:hypothetical protein
MDGGTQAPIAPTLAVLLALAALVAACAGPRPESKPAASGADEPEVVVRGLDEGGESHEPAPATTAPGPEAEQTRKTFSPYARTYPIRAYFGDTHLHTANSGDAFTAGNRLSPEQAYRFALGEEVVSSTGVPARLSRPLDFLVVTDHAEGLGIGYRVYEGDPAFASDPTLARWTRMLKEGGQAAAGLLRGLEQDATLGANPFKFGFVGSTDAHTSLSAVEEDGFMGKHVYQEPSVHRSSHVSKQGFGKTRYTWHYMSAGYAGVWATENTREALWDAMKRREVFGTSGPRIVVRFFGGWGFGKADARLAALPEAGYTKGVPMGSDLQPAPAGAKAPSFLVAATKDPLSGNLDRIQIVKGWLGKDGKGQEMVYDAVWGDADKRRVRNGKLAPVGDTVDVATATWTNTIGDPELAAAWTDPDFDPSVRAFYYARVVEIPTPRWTAYDALRFGIQMPAEVPMKHQERAWASPIWYTPGAVGPNAAK